MPVESTICRNLKLLAATFQMQAASRKIMDNGKWINYILYQIQSKKLEDLKSPPSQLIMSQSKVCLFQLTGAPATSPGSTGSGSNLSPSCGESSAASAHNPAPSPLSSHRSLPGNVPDAMGGHQVTEKHKHIFWIVSEWENMSGPTAAGQLPGRPLLLLSPTPSALLHDAGTHHSLTLPWWAVKTFQMWWKSESNDFSLKQRRTHQQSRIPTQASPWNPPLPFTDPWWVHTTFLSIIAQKRDFGVWVV